MVNGHPPVSHKVKHQDELRGITAKLIKIEKLEVRTSREALLNGHPFLRVFLVTFSVYFFFLSLFFPCCCSNL